MSDGNAKEFKIILHKCDGKCPNYYYSDGGGHCDSAEYCKGHVINNRMSEIKMWGDHSDGNFPKFCPLKNVSIL